MVTPRLIGGTWVGEPARSRPVKLLLRAVGVRDVALGVATLNAFENESDNTADLVRLGAVCDTADAVATVLAYPQLPKRRRFVSLLVAGGAAALGFLVAENLD